MPTKPFDLLSYLPSAQSVRQRLSETERLAARLRIILRVAEEIECTAEADDDSAQQFHGRSTR